MSDKKLVSSTEYSSYQIIVGIYLFLTKLIFGQTHQKWVKLKIRN